MSKLIWSAIASTYLQLLLTNSVFIPSTNSNIYIPLTAQVKTNSWQEKFEQKRKESEFLDDDMEKLLMRNKKWLILMSVIFVWMIYKSLWSSR